MERASRPRRTAPLIGALSALALVVGAAPADARELPDTYTVATTAGVLPEGITVHRDGTIYVTSDGTGTIYRGDVGHDRLEPLAADGATARGTSLGIHTDERGRVWSVGGDTLTVHTRNGRLLDTRTVAGGPLGPVDLNDLVITRDAVYVTDWANPVVHRAPITHGRVGVLRPWLDMTDVIPGFPSQYWLLNGIVADATGSTLLVASNGTEAVWRVDVASRGVEALHVDEPSFGPDGMVLRGRTLYAVLNYGARAGVYVATLDRDLRSAHVTDRVYDDAAGRPFDVPTAVAPYGCRLYVTNSQIDHAPGTPPYTVSAVTDPTCS
ncbi:SMP-30/gluconolactonase/LRE family protein [Luteipulveratus halotolerans]|uniref:Superoxide dismutase n=1 Tax=Luteipulveratus halotolerans TaxID=1631356 RepID=A0A0L6CM65_9MICO|nr:hypothetical protein [Luteipulveratus halotolerans]KNX38618.1 hypothetical protein VV01_18090 [Luteipulveratus halotolerans]